MLPAVKGARLEEKDRSNGWNSGGGAGARFRALYRGALLRDIACGIRRGGDPRGETRRQRRPFRSSSGRGRRRRAVPPDQSQQEMHHTRPDEGRRARGAAATGREVGRGGRQPAAPDTESDETRLRNDEGDKARHYSYDRDRIRRTGAVVGAGWLR